VARVAEGERFSEVVTARVRRVGALQRLSQGRVAAREDQDKLEDDSPSHVQP
jgi:hypothetical protein